MITSGVVLCPGREQQTTEAEQWVSGLIAMTFISAPSHASRDIPAPSPRSPRQLEEDAQHSARAKPSWGIGDPLIEMALDEYVGQLAENGNQRKTHALKVGDPLQGALECMKSRAVNVDVEGVADVRAALQLSGDGVRCW